MVSYIKGRRVIYASPAILYLEGGNDMKDEYISDVAVGVGEKLYDLRKDKHLTMEDVAKETGLSASTISNYERGSTSPTYDALTKLLVVYETSFFEFLSLDLTEYKKDLEVFKRYGLSETFCWELLLSQKYRHNNDIADCINLIFDCPIYAHQLFEELHHFFNIAYHEQVDQITVELPPDASGRLLLEPVISTLFSIFNAKYPERRAEMFSSAIKGQAKQQKKIQSDMVGLTRKLDRIEKKLNDK